MDVHVFTQRIPQLVAGMDDTATYLVRASSEEDARDRLVDATGEPNGDHIGLRNDAGRAYRVQYHGTVDQLLGGVPVANIRKGVSSDESETIEID